MVVEKCWKTTRMKPWAFHPARDPRTLTSTEKKKVMDGCRSWVDASDVSFWTIRMAWISCKHCPSHFCPWSHTGPLSGTIITLTHEWGWRYSRNLPWKVQQRQKNDFPWENRNKHKDWLIKACEIHCSVRTNLRRDNVQWDLQHLKKKCNIFQLKQFSMQVSAEYMEEIHILAFHTHPTAGAGYSQLIWFETWFILSVKSCLKFSNTFTYFQTYFPSLKTAWEATDSSALKCDIAKAWVKDFGLSQLWSPLGSESPSLPSCRGSLCRDYHMQFHALHIHVQQEGHRKEQHEFLGLSRPAKTMSSLLKKLLIYERAPPSLQKSERGEHCREGGVDIGLENSVDRMCEVLSWRSQFRSSHSQRTKQW